MAATSSLSQSTVPNRRRRVRHKIQTPAYASFAAQTTDSMLDLHEIVDISEDGVALQCHSPLNLDQSLDLCLDLADCAEQIYTKGHVVWSNNTGRVGVRFTEFPAASLSRLREWLFVNVMAGVANSEVDLSRLSPDLHKDDATNTELRSQPAPKPAYTDKLAAVTAVQRQVEALGSDLAGVLQLIADRVQSLLQASGAAIALVDSDPEFMICRSSSGPDAPPVGARLQVGSGFSGECVKRGSLLRCDDTENDTRVDRESCRALGIRSILAVPVRVGEKSVGIVEALSGEANAFSEADGRVVERLADAVLEAVNRSAVSENLPPLRPTEAPRFEAPQGSVLFASARDDEDEKPEKNEKHTPGITLPRSYLILLTCAAATIALALGFISAPWIQSEVAPWVLHKLHNSRETQLQTVLASSQPPKPEGPPVETANLDQLRQMAEKGNALAQNTLGLRYAIGDGVSIDEKEAVRWFTKAAEQGNVAAQSKLGSIYYSGRGVPKDPNRAYFWMVVARLSGDDASKTLAPFVRAQLSRSQVASIEQEAGRWLEQHATNSKPTAGQIKSSL
ncbi:MAG TPA: GAF domain-containing protein [Candidatus Sulfotelmatobacter sp.]|nr:GAF domain-containing protein [Candidatus Sulfotelmatobacter sp.]